MSSGLTPLQTFREAEGRSITDIAVQGIGAWLLSVFLSLIAGFNQLFEFLFLPFRIFIDAAIASLNAFVIEPLRLTRFGLFASAEAISEFGIAGLPVSVIVVLVTLFLVLIFLQFEITSNLLPGLFVDNRLYSFFFTTPEEEAQGED